MNWYYAKGDNRHGPVDTEILRSLVEKGEIDATTLVWNETLDGWKRLTEIDLSGDQEAAFTCAECGRSFPAGETVEFEGRSICAECKPRFVQRVREGVLTPGHLRYGGFWIRFLARVVDSLILAVANTPIAFAFGGFMTFDPNQEPSLELLGATCLVPLLQLAVAVAYETGFVGAKGATPGKMICSLKIVTADGGRVSYARALGRHFATFLSSMTLLIGYVIAAFDDQKRTLHDHICHTRVIRA